MASSNDYVENIETYTIKRLPYPFENYYATSCGRVISSSRGRLKFINGKLDKDGYVTLILRSEGKNYYKRLHRLVALAFLGEAPIDKPIVRHIDGNLRNNSIDNLAYGTQKENIADKAIHGTKKIGSSVHSAKINEDTARIILEMLSKGLTAKSIAEHFNITPSIVYSIKRGVTWWHVLN